ncbi:hypothetical protein BDR26DRAFT_1006591 [Obelidium mucronatum]|nr:hypothetical protein BDR26DRAFT_1006591 [Obelidium mucronatum]
MEFLQACAAGNVEAVARFLPAAAEDKRRVVNYAHPMNGFTGLMWAAKRGHVGVARLLLASGADAAAEDARGRTAAALASDAATCALLAAAPPPPPPAAPAAPKWVPNYLVDASALPPIDLLRADAEPPNTADQSKPSAKSIPPSASSSSSSPPSARPKVDLSSLQEIVVYLASRFDADERSIVGAIHIPETVSIASMLQQAYSELDILTEPDSKIPTIISRLDNVKRVIPISKKQYDQMAALHFKHGNSLIIHQN